MKKTLVSFIGRGQKSKKDNKTYQRTNYEYGTKTHETALFVEAMFAFRKEDIADCVLIGTHGSSWAALIEKIEREDDKYLELFVKLDEIYNENENGDQVKIDKALIQELSNVLSQEWQLNVKCEVHDSIIADNNVIEILYQYVNALSQYNSSGFLLDITHSLRSMPTVLMSSLPILETISGIKELEIFYGEYDRYQGKGFVRELAQIWHEQKFNQAVRHFNQSFDGHDLAKQIEGEWQSGAIAIRTLGDIIQANYVVQLDKAVKHASTALDAFNKITEPSSRIKLAAHALKLLTDRITSKKYHHEQVLILAELLKERRLWGQAIITLELSFEAYLFYYYPDAEDQYGDFELTKKLRLQFIDELDTTNRRNCNNLYNTRNSIAHGGSPSNDGKEKKLKDLPSLYGTFSLWLKDLYKGKY